MALYTPIPGAWASYTPTLTNVTTGNGTLTARYVQIGKTVFVRGTFVMGTTSSITGGVQISLPVTANSTAMVADIMVIGGGVALDSGVFAYPLDCVYHSTTTMVLNARISNSGTNPVYGDINTNRIVTTTVPLTWATADTFTWQIMYEAA